jgi:hypothetical protein
MMMPGEKEAMCMEWTTYFRLHPLKGADALPCTTHFRRAESQFYRMGHTSSLKVHRIEYVVNPRLIRAFNAKQSELSGESSIPVYGFHGSSAGSITSICENGFYEENHPKHRTLHGSVHGPGIYFARDSTTSVAYAQDSKTLLMCLLLVTPEDKQPNETGIIVIKESVRCLPTYIIHFGPSPVQEAEGRMDAPDRHSSPMTSSTGM